MRLLNLKLKYRLTFINLPRRVDVLQRADTAGIANLTYSLLAEYFFLFLHMLYSYKH